GRQGRPAAPDPGAGAGMGALRHPRQCHRAGVFRNRHQSRVLAHAGRPGDDQAHSPAPARPAGRPGRPAAAAGVRCLGLHDRQLHHCRRWASAVQPVTHLPSAHNEQPEEKAMLKLYGFPVSNYYNVVKAALLEKGMAFEEVQTQASGAPEYLAISPMGKVPCLETPQGAFSESQVMLDYLEEAQPEPRLYPADAFARAKVRELLRVLELYLELPARRLYPEAFFGGSVSEQTKAEV